MTKQHVLSAYLQMADAVKHIEGDLAWLGLKAIEWRPGDPPVWAACGDIATQMLNQQARFSRYAAAIIDTVEDPVAPFTEKERALWRRRVSGLQRRLNGLTLPKAL